MCKCNPLEATKMEIESNIKVGMGGKLIISNLWLSREEHVQMYTSQQSINFNQQVVLRNCYCNCFHLMCRVGKSTWYDEQKRALLLSYSVLQVPVNTRKLSNLALRQFWYPATCYLFFPVIYRTLFCPVITAEFCSLVFLTPLPVVVVVSSFKYLDNKSYTHNHDNCTNY